MQLKKIKNLAIVWDQISWGGVDSYIAYLLNSNSFKNISITIYTNKNNQGIQRLKKLLKREIKIIEYNNIIQPQINNFLLKKIVFFFRPLLFLISFLRFKFIFAQKKYDILLAQCGGYGTIREEMAAILATNRDKIKINSMVIHHACTFPPPFMTLFVRFINFLLSKKLTSLISVSKATRESVFYKSNLLDSQLLHDVVIYNGVDTERKETINNLIKRKKINVGFISRLEKYKGHEDLIWALKKIPEKELSHFNFIFIGGGTKDFVANLKELTKRLNLSEYVIFKGYVDKDIKEIVKDFDLVVSLTRTFEGFGLAIVESIMSNIPVITTKVGAIEEYLTKEYCEIIEPGSIDQIKESILDYHKNRANWINRSIKAKKYIEQNFSAEKMADEYKSHLEQKLNQN